MEDLLDLYAEPRDAQRPVVCFDERPCQLISETRQVIPAKPGQPERHDYEIFFLRGPDTHMAEIHAG